MLAGRSAREHGFIASNVYRLPKRSRRTAGVSAAVSRNPVVVHKRPNVPHRDHDNNHCLSRNIVAKIEMAQRRRGGINFVKRRYREWQSVVTRHRHAAPAGRLHPAAS